MNPESEIRHLQLALDPGRQYVIGTAGHIDHGKTALVKALTGIDTDRLPEEKARGITIDLGFAHFSENVTIIDVPGHERLIKNMVAGVSTIDLVLFVVAADDGVMPQTREHLDIVNLLQIRHGIFVINKIDLASPEWLRLVEEDLRALLRDTPFHDAPICRVSALSGAGVEELRGLILQTLAAIPPRQDLEVYRQPVDRVFSVKGFGTVITGTVLSGKLRVGEEVEIQPSGLIARVRGLQSHDQEVEEVRAGFRAAVNLAGLELEQVQRGMVLAQPGLYHPVEIFNARLALLKSSPIPLKNNQRIRLHIHTAETFARVIIPHAAELKPGESAFVQILLERPVHAAYQDRFIMRQYSPQRTIGGGVVLQTAPLRFRKKYSQLFQQTLQRLESEEAQPRILAAFNRLTAAPLTLWQIKIATNLALQELQRILKELQSREILFSENLGGETVYFSREQLEEILKRIEEALASFHRAYPARPGMGEVEIIGQLEKTFLPEALRRALGLGIKWQRMVREGQYLRLAAFSPQLSAKESQKYRELETCYREAHFNPPTVKEVMERFALSQKEFKELSKLLREEGKLVYLDETLLFHGSIFPRLEALLREFFSRKPEISVAEFKELTGTTRKHAIPLLEYLDKNGFTERAGDLRKAGPRLN